MTNMTPNMPFVQEQAEEAVILHDVTSMAQSTPGLEVQANLEQLKGLCLEAFWTRFNPMFNIMHRYTFDTEEPSPLVRALMIAIGTQFFDDEAAQTMARTLRETCAKLMLRVSIHR